MDPESGSYKPAICTASRLAVCKDVYAKLDELQLLNSDYQAIKTLQQLLNVYVRTDVQTRKPLKGQIDFPEANRVIFYKLPVIEGDAARIVLEHRFRPASQ